jgi:hypothetical protein
LFASRIPPSGILPLDVLAQAARYKMVSGHHDESVAIADEAIALAASVDAPGPRASALITRATAMENSGAYETATRWGASSTPHGRSRRLACRSSRRRCVCSKRASGFLRATRPARRPSPRVRASCFADWEQRLASTRLDGGI